MIFSVFQKVWVFRYSWSTLIWCRCYYPHWLRDALSTVCGIFMLWLCISKHFSAPRLYFELLAINYIYFSKVALSWRFEKCGGHSYPSTMVQCCAELIEVSRRKVIWWVVFLLTGWHGKGGKGALAYNFLINDDVIYVRINKTHQVAINHRQDNGVY